MEWKKTVAKAAASLLLAAGINACSDESKNLAYQQAVTDSSGRVTFNDTPFTVKDDVTLEGITVHYLESNNHYLALAVDGRGRHFPAVKGGSIDTVEHNLTQKPLLQELIIIMSLAYQGYKLYRSTQSPDRILLEETENINRYCISLEQMKNDYIDLPAGILSLAPAAGDEAEEIEMTITTPLKMLMENYVINKYGEQEGYEIWVPKIDTSFCGNDYKNVVCPIDTPKLSQRLWNKAEVPIWEIKGPCRLDDTGEQDAAAETPEKFNLVKNSDGTISDLRNSLQWFQNAQNLPWRDAVSYCNNYNFDSSGWRLPTAQELEIYILETPINGCYAPILFNGCDEIWNWSSEASGTLTQAVSYQFGRRQGRDNNPFYSNGAKCVRRFL
ncbi:MAG: DUF1566 domain-containing protein [Nanoarchaeota archaeon]|nr:DUF1566 domain-containing protein [Nanoarchaeota archaeon]